MARQECNSERASKRVDIRDHANTLSNAPHRLPDDFVGSLGAANARKTTVGDHVVVGSTPNLTRPDCSAQDPDEFVGHRLNRRLAALFNHANRSFFEVDRAYITVAALGALVEQGELKSKIAAEAIRKYGIDPDKSAPVGV